ncbi:MAG: type II secretion system F family protein [Chloroflexi bacterium]|nr:type II secretion system F family protein [Chloroflexota bacterium]
MNVELVALIGALGIFFIILSFESLAVTRRAPRSRLRQAVDADQVEPLRVFAGRPLLDRLFGPLVLQWAGRLRALLKRGEQDEQRLQMAGAPARYPTVNDFYAYKVLYGVGAFVVGAFAVATLDLGAGWVWLPLVLGVAGLFWPDLQVRRLINRRQDDLLAEMAFTLDRLAVHVAAGQTLAQAQRDVARQPGGLFTQELQRIVREYQAGVPLPEAWAHFAARYPHVNEAPLLAGQIAMAHDKHQEIVPGLQAMAVMIRDRVEANVLARGVQTPVFMTIVLGVFILPAIAIIVGGPGIVMIFTQFL